MGSTNPLPKINTLAVDDIPANLMALEAVLASDYNLILANSGEQALSILQARQDIGMILMDLQMPGMDGFETASLLRNLEGCHEIPIIFITAIYKEDPFVRKGYEVGAVDYFSKPFDPDILKRKVDIYCSFGQKTALLKERERQIRESEELLKASRKLSSVLESLAVGVLIADVEGRIFQSNEEVSRICKSIEPLESDCYGEMLGWWDSKGQMIKDINGPLSRAIHHGDTTHNQIIHIDCFDGTPKTLLGSASPLLGLEGKIVGAVVLIQDVTETQKIGEDFEQRITKLISLGVELEQSARH